MTAKEIGRNAGRIFQNIIPAHWLIRNQEDQEDYGIDYELEQTDRNDHATGFLFKVQQKGVEKLSDNNDGKTVSYSGLKVEKVRYYLMMQVPIVFVVVGVESKAIYWIMVQGNPQVKKAYKDAIEANQETMTFNLWKENSLPESFDAMVVAVKNTYEWILVNGINTMPPTALLSVAIRNFDINESTAAFARHYGILRCEQMENQVRTGELDAAFATAEKIFEGQSETIEMRMAAALHLLQIQPMLDKNRSQDTAKETEFRLKIVRQLFQFTKIRGTDRRLRIYAAFLLRAATMSNLVNRDFALFLSLQAQQRADNIVSISMMTNMRTSLAASILKQFHFMQNQMFWMTKHNGYHLFPSAWIHLVRDFTPFVNALWRENQKAAESLIKWLDETGVVAVEISKKLENPVEVMHCAITGLALAIYDDKKNTFDNRFNAALNIIRGVTDEPARNKGLAMLTEARKTFDTAKPTTENLATMHRNTAANMGIDLSDENDPIAEIIRIGIEDLNPERVLKNCQHLHAGLGSPGLPGQMLGLPTAGSKHLACIKHGHDVSGLKLDNIYQVMQRFHCTTCPDAMPHPSSWKWTHEWQEQQNKLKSAPTRNVKSNNLPNT